MSKKIRIRYKQGWIAYSGSTLQQNYSEDLVHGYLKWQIENRDKFSVEFKELPNPKPFVTIEWAGNASKTYQLASVYPKGSRFRIKCYNHIVQQEVQSLSSMLKNSMNATEVTFKIDQQINKETLHAGTQTLIRADLRNCDVLLKLIRNYHPNNTHVEEVWTRVSEQVKSYLQVVMQTEDSIRNVKWSIRSLKFDNMFAYGEGNSINFDNLNGIVGIFGPNRAGKSSIVGSVMYLLFNTTDRGSMKNLYVCNIRKPFCYSRAIVDVNGIDYVFERQTTKHENRKGVQHATTALNVYKINELGEAVDLAGEQRNDTEKVIRSLIGNSDDFLLTSLAAQGEVNQFIEQGSSRRRQILSRFLDLDIFDKMYELAKKDVNNTQVQLRTLPDNDWNLIAEEFKEKLKKISLGIDERTITSKNALERLSDLRAQLARHGDFTPVSKSQLDTQKNRVITLERQVLSLKTNVDDLSDEIEKLTKKASTIDLLKEEHDLVDLKKKYDAYQALESSVNTLKNSYDKEELLLKQQERSLKILDEVPCGDSFPSCKFIKDAHIVKHDIVNQRDRVSKALVQLDKAMLSLNELRIEDFRNKIDKIQKLHDLHSKLKLDISNKHVELLRLETQLVTLKISFDSAKTRLNEIEEALKNDENVEVASFRLEIDKLLVTISDIDAEKMRLASQHGKVISDLEKVQNQKKIREELLHEMKVYELISNAFSRKGIPSVIVTSQLPVINAEISKILTGIVDFTVELEVNEESDSMDVFINYSDSRRIIELASGMEKMISSVAIRVALINISTLPKTNMFILDEGFGALDDAGVESCNRLLMLLKRHFKTVIVITHIDGVKDAADTILEITKSEKDARVVYD